MDRKPDRGYFILAHRGARRHAPSNSLAAFDEALKRGFDGVELDLRRTRDGHVIARHDKTFRSGRSRRRVEGADRAELPEEVASLEDVASWGHRHPGALMDVEVKEPGFGADLAKRLASLRAQVVVTSFVPDVLWTLRHATPRLETGFLAMHGGPFNVEIAKMVGARLVVWRDRHVTPEVVSMTREAKLEAYVWDVSSPRRVDELVAWGATGLIMDALPSGR